MASVTRRDFLNGTLIGAGTTLLAGLVPSSAIGSKNYRIPPNSALGQEWYGFGGVGDYAFSHGNTPRSVNSAHRMRDGEFERLLQTAADTKEKFDVIVVGGGMAGLGAAYEFSKLNNKSDRTCLLIDDHPVFGGESKRNELLVEGARLIGPQGANGFSVPPPLGAEAGFAAGDAKYYSEFDIPREFTYAPLTHADRALRFGRDNYGFLYWLEQDIDTGHYFDRQSSGATQSWVKNPWQNSLDGVPVWQRVRQQLLDFYHSDRVPYPVNGFEKRLDSVTYKEVLEGDLGYPPEATTYIDPIVASAVGLGCDAISAYAAYAIGLPGVKGYYEGPVVGERHSFPGGNDGFARHLAKAVIPEAISGDGSFEDILNGSIRFDQLDRDQQAVRMRLDSTVVDVRHAEGDRQSDEVWVTYAQNDQLFKARARAVVMACGAWVNRRVVKELPESHTKAFNTFVHAPFLVANVGLRQWRFLEKLGITACRYDGGFGYSCNLRQPMHVGGYQPALDPDKPAMLTFYVPFWYPGLSPVVQANLGRQELLSKSFAQYEKEILLQMERLFSATGFRSSRDVAAIILNRWGHAYVAPGPGFYFGSNGKPTAREVISQPFGRISFGHSELRGNQHWGPAADEGARAMNQAFIHF